MGVPEEDTPETSVDDYVSLLKKKINGCHEIARSHLKVAALYQKKHYDSNVKKKKFFPGRVVWLHDPSRKVGISTKLAVKWKGPFLVTRMIDDLVCKEK